MKQEGVGLPYPSFRLGGKRMAQRFSFAKWEEELKEKDRENKERLQKIENTPYLCVAQAAKGVSYVFQLLFRENDTNQINFNAFTLDDVKVVLDEVRGYLTTEDAEWIDGESEYRYPFNKGNGFHESRFLEWSVDDLLNTRKKVYEADEDDFI